jgi:hypothetical protein
MNLFFCSSEASKMHLLRLGIAVLLGASTIIFRSEASPLEQSRWKDRMLVVTGPADDAAVKQQRQIYRSAVTGMSERQIILSEALGDSERSRQIRSQLSADGKRFRVFLIGKDGHTAITSEKPLSAEFLFARVDAMPMRRDEMRRDEMRRAR